MTNSPVVTKLYKSAVHRGDRTVYRGAVADLVRDMERAAETVGATLSRWQTNYGQYSVMVTYAVHEGPRTRQFRQLDPSKVRAWTRFYVLEGKTARCVAFRKLAELCEQDWSKRG